MTKEQINGKWKKLEAALLPYTDDPKRAVEYIKELYSVYDRELLTWLGGLYDPKLGGFYYSNSAKDGEGFFPDIESTGQGIAILNSSGAISNYEDIPEWIRSGIAGFICSCEDPDNGYFYNPQWTKETVDTNLSRRARDFGWAIDIAEKLDFEMPYFTVFLNSKNNNRIIPEFLKSEEEFTKYLNSLDKKEHIYESVDEIINQYDPIFYAGYGELALKFIDDLRDEDTGLWGTGYIDEDMQLKTACAALHLYSAMKAELSSPVKLLDFALERFNDTDTEIITTFCDRFKIMRQLIILTSKSKRPDSEATVREMIGKVVDQIPRIIPIAVKQLKQFKKQDGAFSYFERCSSSFSQGMSVAEKNAAEGDVNATLNAIGVFNALIYTLTKGSYQIPLFSKTDMYAFEKAAAE